MDGLSILTNEFHWCSSNSGLVSVLALVLIALNIIRFVVPIGLIAMTVVEIYKNVINPDEKDSMKKIGYRLAAAILVFLTPTIVNLVMNFITNVAEDNPSNTTGNNTSCVSESDSFTNCWNCAKNKVYRNRGGN